MTRLPFNFEFSPRSPPRSSFRSAYLHLPPPLDPLPPSPPPLDPPPPSPPPMDPPPPSPPISPSRSPPILPVFLGQQIPLVILGQQIPTSSSQGQRLAGDCRHPPRASPAPPPGTADRRRLQVLVVQQVQKRAIQLHGVEGCGNRI